MEEAKIRQIVQQELQRSNNAARFGVNNIPFHTHDGVNSPQVKAENIIPSVSVVGAVSLSTQGQTYNLFLNSSFTPQAIICHSIVSSSSGEIYRGAYFGMAQLTPTFYFQPDTAAGVVTGNIQYPFPTEQPDGSKPTVPAQSSSGLLVSRSTDANVFANQSEDHIVSAYVDLTESGIRARATVVGFSRDSIQVYVPYLTSGWSIDACFIIM
jgi:hypothetical protein